MGNSNHLYRCNNLLYIFIIFLSAIDIFMFYINFEDKDWLYVGTATHLALLLLIDIAFSVRQDNRMLYYTYILSCYIILPCCFFGVSCFDNALVDLGGEFVLCLIPFALNSLIAKKPKQFTILTINSMMVVGFSQQNYLLTKYGLNDAEGVGVNTLLTASTLITATLLSIIQYFWKYRKSR